MPSQRRKPPVVAAPQRGWAIYLRTSSDENQKPELSRACQRTLIEKSVLERSDMPVIGEYVDVLTGKTTHREGYQRLLKDARAGKFSHVIVERADRFGRNDTEELMEKMGLARPDESERLRAVLKGIDEEEERTLRLYAAGAVSEVLWYKLWAGWQDRRNQIKRTLDTLALEQDSHIAGLAQRGDVAPRLPSLRQ